MSEFFLNIGWGPTFFIYIMVIFYGERFLAGTIVGKIKFEKKVNYSRKVGHFCLFLCLMQINELFNDPTRAFLGGVVSVVLLALSYNKYSRTKLGFLSLFFSVCFRSFDRPEDDGHTLRWLLAQYIGSYVVVIPAIIIFEKVGWEELVYIPLLINAFGDGGAEPIGILLGKHKYTTKSFIPIWDKKSRFFIRWERGKDYIRSLEGSACVLLSGVVIIFSKQQFFSPAQFWTALFVVPIITTLAEAKSPHTMDSPLILLTGYVSLGMILAFL